MSRREYEIHGFQFSISVFPVSAGDGFTCRTVGESDRFAAARDDRVGSNFDGLVFDGDGIGLFIDGLDLATERRPIGSKGAAF